MGNKVFSSNLRKSTHSNRLLMLIPIFYLDTPKPLIYNQTRICNIFVSTNFFKNNNFYFQKRFFLSIRPTVNNVFFNNYTNLKLRTKHGLSFILYSLGLVLPLRFFYKAYKINLFVIKKKMYTFLKINEYKMHIFNTKKKALLYKFIFFKKKNFIYNSSYYLYNFFNKEKKNSTSNFFYKRPDF